MVIVLGFDIGFYWIRADIYQHHQSTMAPEGGRNERSTPRSFILPATPAVAFEQETRSAKNSTTAISRHQVAVCAIRLLDLGYDVGDEPVAFNAKLSEAIYEYQKKYSLNKTGKLDPATIRSLSCELK
jgi:Putative peptidoglycan binding domain